MPSEKSPFGKDKPGRGYKNPRPKVTKLTLPSAKDLKRLQDTEYSKHRIGPCDTPKIRTTRRPCVHKPRKSRIFVSMRKY